MVKRYIILIGIITSLLLMYTATTYYPGGSPFYKDAVGFSWKYNYISNLFGEKAWNGMPNTARFWAVGGMMFLSMSFSIFFFEFAKRIPQRGAANVIKYMGILGMFFTFLIATPLHDTMVICASTIFLLAMFYITVFVFKSKLHLFKLLCVFYLLLFYGTLYLYGSGDFRQYLPIIQKLLFAMTMIMILVLHYFTDRKDFAHTAKQIKPKN